MTFTPLVLIDARIYFASLDATGFANKIDMNITLDDLDSTTFRNNRGKARVAGLEDLQAAATMLWQAGDASMPDDVLWNQLGAASQPLTVAPTLGSVGSIAYITKTMSSQYKISGDVAKLLTTEANWLGNQPTARGQVLHPQGTIRTTTGTGTAVQLGAVTAAQRMWANLHVFSVAGTATPTLTVKIQSSVDNTFAAPTDRITFTAATGFTSQPASVLGAVTDTWWRAVWTISGSTPSFLFAVAAGIAAKS